MKLRDHLLKKFMSYLSSCPHLYHPCPCPYSFRHPCRSLFSSAYIQLAFFSFSYFCHVLVRTHPCHHCHNLRASALATPVTTWRHSHLRAFKNTIFDSTLNSQLNFTTAQTHYSLRGQAQHSISKTQKNDIGEKLPLVWFCGTKFVQMLKQSPGIFVCKFLVTHKSNIRPLGAISTSAPPHETPLSHKRENKKTLENLEKQMEIWMNRLGRVGSKDLNALQGMLGRDLKAVASLRMGTIPTCRHCHYFQMTPTMSSLLNQQHRLHTC